MIDIGFDEKREASSGDKVSFEGDILILIFLQVSEFFLDSFAFDLMLKLVMY